ncbi:oxidoreductase [Puerhibacterium puerhi]|uniref:oxidoreductase n=1 Tax=Puerhibacterium puerhi TaxID=2692623 RepID=UPI0022A6D8CE|nr:NADH:flavin oxidoreductase/NADH oxidase [Puerhibacterium puerhi]
MSLRGVTARNRVWLSPMCMYACGDRDGRVGDFHLVHYGAVALGGAGLLVTEATAVSPRGRVTPYDAGLWSDDQVAPWRRVTDFVHGAGARIVSQLAHAGRKGGKYANLPGDAVGGGTIPLAEGGWPLLGASGAAFGRFSAPRRATDADLRQVVADFADAARRAEAAGFDGVELHAAHGYLLHELLSPLTNDRDDAWGGDRAGRERLLLETVDAVRAALPDDKVLLVRLSAADGADGGATHEDTADLARRLADRGVDLVDCSSGGLLAGVEYVPSPGYQVPGAAAVRAAGVPAGAVGLISDPHHAEAVVSAGHADVVLLGRELLRDPHWARRAAVVLDRPGAVAPPPRYHRAWRDAQSRPFGT